MPETLGSEVDQIARFIAPYCDPSQNDRDHYVRVKIGRDRHGGKHWGASAFYLTDTPTAKEGRVQPPRRGVNPHVAAGEIWRRIKSLAAKGPQKAWVEIVAADNTNPETWSEPIDVPTLTDLAESPMEEILTPGDMVKAGIQMLQAALNSAEARNMELRSENSELRTTCTDLLLRLQDVNGLRVEDLRKYYEDRLGLNVEVLKKELDVEKMKAARESGDEEEQWGMLLEMAGPYIAPALQEILRRMAQGTAPPSAGGEKPEEKPRWQGTSPSEKDPTAAIEWWMQGLGACIMSHPSALTEDQWKRLHGAVNAVDVQIASVNGWSLEKE